MDMVFTNFREDGALETNYWTTEWALRGFAYCVIRARVFHLLMPLTGLAGGDNIDDAVREMRTGKKVVVSRADKSRFRLMFDDDTETPYCIFLDVRQFSTLPAASDDGRTDVTLTVHLAGGETVTWPAEIRLGGAK